MLKLIYVGFSFPHHGEHAGYDQIRKYINYDKIIDCQLSYDFLCRFFKTRTIFNRAYNRIFGDKLWWIELYLIMLSIFNPKKYVFHIIYGENIFEFLGYFKFGNKIAVTIHQPPSYFEDSKQKSFLKKLQKVDKFIVMSSDMESYFKNKFPEKDVLYIHHGVDTDFFKPKGIKGNQILLIGSWLRDFEFASKVFNRLLSIDPTVNITVITKKENYSYFENNALLLISSISDDNLLQYYQCSKIVFLPLKQFTANNSMLEALSCGCQVIVATKKDNIDNSNDKRVLFVEENVNNVCECLIKTLKNWDVENELNTRDSIIQSASWNVIGKITSDFINSSRQIN